MPAISGFDRRWLRSDVVAGLTVWAVLVPEALAYATIADLPPVVGLYAAVPALVIYAFLGSSRQLVVGPITATAALSGTISATYSNGEPADALRVAITLALIVGALGLVAGVCRLGFLVSFISEPVLKGFIIGMALTIIVGQVPALLRVDKAEGGFFGEVWHLVRHLPDAHGPTVGVGVGSLALILVLRRQLPRVPASLVAVVLGILAVALLGLDGQGVEVVGHIDAGLPVPGLPGSDVGQYLELVAPAAGVLLVGFVEHLAAASTYARQGGYDLDVDRELTATGGANLGAGLVGGMVVDGSISKTAVNASAGARSQASGLVTAALTAITLLFLTGLFEQLPEAVLAAVVLTAVIDLVDFSSLRRLYAAGGAAHLPAARADFVAAMGALLGVLVLETLPGLLVGVVLSIVLLLYRSSRPHVAALVRLPAPADTWVDAERHPELSSPPHVVVARVEGGLFFANSDLVHDRLHELVGPDTKALVLDARAVSSVDVTGAAMLDRLAGELDAEGVRLLVAGAFGQFRDTAKGSKLFDRVHRTVDGAVAAAAG